MDFTETQSLIVGVVWVIALMSLLESTISFVFRRSRKGNLRSRPKLSGKPAPRLHREDAISAVPRVYKAPGSEKLGASPAQQDEPPEVDEADIVVGLCAAMAHYRAAFNYLESAYPDITREKTLRYLEREGLSQYKAGINILHSALTGLSEEFAPAHRANEFREKFDAIKDAALNAQSVPHAFVKFIAGENDIPAVLDEVMMGLDAATRRLRHLIESWDEEEFKIEDEDFDPSRIFCLGIVCLFVFFPYRVMAQMLIEKSGADASAISSMYRAEVREWSEEVRVGFRPLVKRGRDRDFEEFMEILGEVMEIIGNYASRSSNLADLMPRAEALAKRAVLLIERLDREGDLLDDKKIEKSPPIVAGSVVCAGYFIPLRAIIPAFPTSEHNTLSAKKFKKSLSKSLGEISTFLFAKYPIAKIIRKEMGGGAGAAVVGAGGSLTARGLVSQVVSYFSGVVARFILKDFHYSEFADQVPGFVKWLRRLGLIGEADSKELMDQLGKNEEAGGRAESPAMAEREDASNPSVARPSAAGVSKSRLPFKLVKRRNG